MIFVFFIGMKNFLAHHFQLLHRRMGLGLKDLHCCCLHCYSRWLRLRLVIALGLAAVDLLVVAKLLVVVELRVAAELLAVEPLGL